MRSTSYNARATPAPRRHYLVLFDIDGTLTRSNEMDTDCFVRAMSEHLGKPVDSDWSGYRNVTDSGIAAELLQRYGRPPGECDRVKSRFIDLISQVLRSSPSCCRQVPGAGAFLDRLRHAPGVQIGLATGGWAASARAKLSLAIGASVNGHGEYTQRQQEDAATGELNEKEAVARQPPMLNDVRYRGVKSQGNREHGKPDKHATPESC